LLSPNLRAAARLAGGHALSRPGYKLALEFAN
jgi:hypothetical protein